MAEPSVEMNFEQNYVEVIEAALERERRGMWNRQFSSIPEFGVFRKSISPVAVWRVPLPRRYTQRHSIAELLILVDGAFPRSQPRICVPGLQVGDWPHVEPGGLLCLKETLIGACPGERILQLIEDAIELLSFDENYAEKEFRREFATYWDQKSSNESQVRMYSLVSLTKQTKKVVFAYCSRGDIYYFADSKLKLENWLRNRRATADQFGDATLHWLPQPLIPKEFPTVGEDVTRLIDDGAILSTSGVNLVTPVLLGATTESGDVVVGVLLKPSRIAVSTDGFRPNGSCWKKRLKRSILSEKVMRRPIERVDGDYIHSRGHGGEYSVLKDKRVAIVGCGSLGSSICMLLAQAGVGSFLLVDPDHLKSHNTSRHVLGNRFIGNHKTSGLKIKIQEDFPHLAVDSSISKNVEDLSDEEMERLSSCDLIISSGIDFTGVQHIVELRLRKYKPPFIACWAEPFSLSGHSFGIFGDDTLESVINEHYRSAVEMVDWSGVDVLVAEAGCGNYFQPHGAVDLQRIAVMSAKHALDVLRTQTSDSEHRSWLGDRSAIVSRGGTIKVSDFRAANSEESTLWPVNRA